MTELNTELNTELKKPYTDKEYAEFAVKANELGKIIEIYDDRAEMVDPPPPTPEEIAAHKAMLSMTKRDFMLALQEFGVTYEQVKELLAANAAAQMEWELCERVYRGNPYLDQLCSVLGVTPQQLDGMFGFADGLYE
jgi:hypothetical protein